MASSTIHKPPHTDPEARRKDRRRTVYEARRRVWQVTDLKRVRLCGWAPRSDEGVSIRVSTCEGVRRAGLGNVQTCGSFWACPVCSEKIAAHRQSQIEQVLRWWTRWDAGSQGDQVDGGRVAHVVLTVSHKRFNQLATVWDTVAACWAKVTSGGAWKGEQLAHGAPMLRQIRSGKRAGQWVLEHRIRTVRVIEVTHGVNGWHVHVHALLLLNRDATDESVARLGAGIARRWNGEAVRRLGRAPSKAHGMRIDLLRGDPAAAMGDYFTKAGFAASWEVAGGMRKDARNGNRTPFAILRGVIEPDLDAPLDRPEEDLALWHEWERTSKGRRAIAFSPGLLDEACVEDVTDEQIVEEELGGEDEARIDPMTWRAIRRHNGICDLLEAFEDSHDAGVRMLWFWHDRAAELAADGRDGPPPDPR